MSGTEWGVEKSKAWDFFSRYETLKEMNNEL